MLGDKPRCERPPLRHARTEEFQSWRPPTELVLKRQSQTETLPQQDLFVHLAKVQEPFPASDLGRSMISSSSTASELNRIFPDVDTAALQMENTVLKRALRKMQREKTYLVDSLEHAHAAHAEAELREDAALQREQAALRKAERLQQQLDRLQVHAGHTLLTPRAALEVAEVRMEAPLPPPAIERAQTLLKVTSPLRARRDRRHAQDFHDSMLLELCGHVAAASSCSSIRYAARAESGTESTGGGGASNA
jgi:hypothetical protein